MKLVPVTAVLLCTLVVADQARAETVHTRLTPKKTGDHLYSFAIKVGRLESDTEELLQFRVTVKPAMAGKSTPLSHRSGTLAVHAGKEFVSSCEVQPTEHDGELSYSFRVAAKYAEKSSFTFAEGGGSQVEFGGFYYWFYLADFAAPPPVAPAAPADKIKIENPSGFRTAGPGEFFRRYWDSVKDTGKMAGKVSDHLTREQIDSVVMLEVGIAVAVGPGFPTLQDELLGFMTDGNRFDTAPLPEGFDKNRPLKYAVGLLRTKKGEYGLVTRYRDFAVVELNGRVGVAPVKADRRRIPSAPASEDNPRPGADKKEKNPTDDERLKLLKPEMTFDEIRDLWRGKKSLGQTCGEGVNKLTGDTGGAYGEVYEWKPAGAPKLSSLKVGYFQGKDRPYEVRGPGFQYYLKGGKYVAVRPAKGE